MFSKKPLRLIVFDGSSVTRRNQPWLVGLWTVWARFLNCLGHIDAFKAAADWRSTFEWLNAVEPSRSIAAIQFWGHGKWGRALIGDDTLTLNIFSPGNPDRNMLQRLRSRFLPNSQTQFWFRTCETFGASAGVLFAKYWARFMSCRAVGHTHIIWLFQGGLSTVRSGEEPSWCASEGIAQGTPDRPARSFWSKPWSPRTVSCFRMHPKA